MCHQESVRGGSRRSLACCGAATQENVIRDRSHAVWSNSRNSKAPVVAGLEVSAPDDATVVYRLNRRSPVFLLLASIWPLYPVRQDLIEQHGDSWTEAGNLVTNGPFVPPGMETAARAWC